MLSRSGDLNVAWTGTASNVAVTLSSLAAGHTVQIVCNFPSSPGTVGAAAMGKLIPSGMGVSEAIQIYPQDKSTFSAGDYSVSFSATGTGATGTFTTN